MRYTTVNSLKSRLLLLFGIVCLFLGYFAYREWYEFNIVFEHRSVKEYFDTLFSPNWWTMGSPEELEFFLIYTFIGLICLIFSFIYFKRWMHYKKIIKNGTPYPAVITGASYVSVGFRRGYIARYVLYLIFFDKNGKKKMFMTQFYDDDPNIFLADNKCKIYEYDGEYAEGDLINKTGIKNWFLVRLEHTFGRISEEEMIRTNVISRKQVLDNTVGKLIKNRL